MSGLKKIKWKHYINYIAVAAFTLLFTILSFSGALKSSDLYLLEKIAISVMLATSLSMVVGFLGELSLGHAGFMCVGAYLGGKVSVLLEPPVIAPSGVNTSPSSVTILNAKWYLSAIFVAFSSVSTISVLPNRFDITFLNCAS